MTNRDDAPFGAPQGAANDAPVLSLRHGHEEDWAEALAVALRWLAPHQLERLSPSWQQSVTPFYEHVGGASRVERAQALAAAVTRVDQADGLLALHPWFVAWLRQQVGDAIVDAALVPGQPRAGVLWARRALRSYVAPPPPRGRPLHRFATCTWQELPTLLAREAATLVQLATRMTPELTAAYRLRLPPRDQRLLDAATEDHSPWPMRSRDVLRAMRAAPPALDQLAVELLASTRICSEREAAFIAQRLPQLAAERVGSGPHHRVSPAPEAFSS